MIRFLTIILSIIFISSTCEDDILINTEFEEEYVLNCVMDADSEKHIAIITRSYAIDGFNPQNNIEDKFIKGADIKLIVGSNEYSFKDTVTDRVDLTRYENPVEFYYVDNVRRLIESDVRIEALLPNGVKLTSFTSVPERIDFVYSKSDILVPEEEDTKTFQVTWKLDTQERLFYDPRLKLVYFIDDGNSEQRLEKDIPIRYDEFNNVRNPVFRSPSYRKFVEYSMEALNNTMIEISEGDSNKRKYKIYRLVLELLTYDEFLTSYYVGTNFLDRFSVRLDEVDYSNVEGGKGIFAAYIKEYFEIDIDAKYIRSFGYEKKLLK